MAKKNRNASKKSGSLAERIRKRAAQQQAGTGGFTTLNLPDGVEFFNPKAGKYLVDILNYKVGKGNPYADEGELWFERTYWVHKNVGTDGKTFVCPKMSTDGRNPCPICEYRAKMQKQGADKKLLSDLKPKERQLFNVIDVTEGPNKKVLIWDISNYCFGKQLDGEIRDADEDDGYVEFPALQGGFTLRLGIDEESVTAESGSYNFIKVNRIAFKPRKRDYDESILSKLLCLDDLLIIPEYGQLEKEFFQDTIDKDDDDDDNDVEDNNDEETPASKKSKKVEEKDDDLEEDDDDDEYLDDDDDLEEDDEDEDEDDDWDDEDLDDDDEEEDKKSVKKKKGKRNSS